MAKRFRVIGERTGDIRLRQSPDREDPKYELWHVWKAGEVFAPPRHMDVTRALERGLIEEVKRGG